MPASPWRGSNSSWTCSSTASVSSKTQSASKEYCSCRLQSTNESAKGRRSRRTKASGPTLPSSSSTWRKKEWSTTKDSWQCSIGWAANSLIKSARLYSTSTVTVVPSSPMRISADCSSTWAQGWRTTPTLPSNWPTARRATSPPTGWPAVSPDHHLYMTIMKKYISSSGDMDRTRWTAG